MPTCKRCSHQHYNFQSCDEAAQKRKAPEVLRRSTPEGFHDYDDKLDLYENVGGTLWLKEGRPMRTGQPIHWPDEAA